jgi:hypothetical protein
MKQAAEQEEPQIQITCALCNHSPRRTKNTDLSETQMSGRQPQLLIREQYTKRSGHQDTGTCKTGE